MALSYTISGGSIGTSNQLTAKVWNKLLHQQVQKKSVFNGLVGRAKGGEGSATQDVTAFPIVEVTDLRKQAGDQVTVGLARQLFTGGPFASARYNAGKVGSYQLVDGESTMTFHNVKVKLGHHRVGLRIEDIHGYQQKSPYDIKSEAKDILSEGYAGLLDDSYLWAVYTGWSPNVIRELGESVAVPLTHPNVMYGANRSTLAEVTTDDVMSTDIIERLAAWAVRESIAPTSEGLLLIIGPSDGYNLRRDSFFKDSQNMAGVRGDSNRMFTRAFGKWGDISVMESSKIVNAFDFDGVTASGGSLTVAAETSALPNNIAYTSLNACVLLGAQAIATAYGEETYMAVRKEDDYGNIAGFASGAVYGARRADFAAAADTGTDGTVKNQSSGIIYTYTGTALSNMPTTWS